MFLWTWKKLISKIEYMCVNERGDGETVLLQGVVVSKIKEFRYLGSTVQ